MYRDRDVRSRRIARWQEVAGSKKPHRGNTDFPVGYGIYDVPRAGTFRSYLWLNNPSPRSFCGRSKPLPYGINRRRNDDVGAIIDRPPVGTFHPYLRLQISSPPVILRAISDRPYRVGNQMISDEAGTFLSYLRLAIISTPVVPTPLNN